MTQMKQERETAIAGVNGVTGPLAKKGRVLDELVMQDKLSEVVKYFHQSVYISYFANRTFIICHRVCPFWRLNVTYLLMGTAQPPPHRELIKARARRAGQQRCVL
jgi:hypothetical protein